MPIYEYRCPNGHHFERFQAMTAPAPENCDVCGASPVELVLFPVAIVTSLLVNDSAAYELAAGIAVVGAFARFAPAPAPARARVVVPALGRLLVRARLRPEPVTVPVPGESPPG